MSHNSWPKIFLLFVFVLLSKVTLAQGGPPLITDDPGTPGDGHWEINIASQIDRDSRKNSYQTPLIDTNYGWGGHIQLNVLAAWIANVDDQGTAGGLSKVSSAVKWRLLDQDDAGVDISIYPRIDTLFPLSNHDPRVNEDGVRYFYPIELAKSFGKWAINPEIGYAYNTRADDEWNYGLVIAYEMEKDRELLAEIHARCPIGEGTELLPEIGTRYAFSEAMSFIGAIGHTTETPVDEPAFWNIYFGMQLRL